MTVRRLIHHQTGTDDITAIGTHHDIKFAVALDDIAVNIVILQHVGSYCKLHLTLLTCLQMDTLEAFEFFYRTTYIGHQVTNLELYHFISLAITCINDSQYGFYTAALRHVV